jgi:hypothetical protein
MTQKLSIKYSIIIARIFIGFVFFVNIQAGFDFYFHPQKYSYAYELIGTSGNMAISGFGLLFLMWNIPYAFALWNPIKHWISLIQAVLMQMIGCIGEIALIFRIPENQYPLLRSSMLRFILFDSIGLFLLLIAFFLTKYAKNSRQK